MHGHTNFESPIFGFISSSRIILLVTNGTQSWIKTLVIVYHRISTGVIRGGMDTVLFCCTSNGLYVLPLTSNLFEERKMYGIWEP